MSLATNPQPLGMLQPGANFATVAVQAVVNIAASIQPVMRLSDLVIQAASGNLASMFITTDGKVPAADYSNVLRELPAGAFYTAGSPTGVGQVDATNYYVAALNATDFAFGEAREV